MTWELMITEGNKQKKAEPNDPAFFLPNSILIYFLKNFLPYPASPINPKPRRSMVAGSGTAGAKDVILSATIWSVPSKFVVNIAVGRWPSTNGVPGAKPVIR
jgi:hypothetical protein